MKSLKQVLGGDVRQYGMLLALVVLTLFFHWKTDGKVLTQSNAANILNGNAYILVLAIGMVMVIVIGQIDLSVGSVAAVVGIVVALSIKNWGIPWWLGILLGLGVGMVIGAWQGFWLAYVGVPGFITTLAGMMLFRGLNQYIGKSVSTSVPEQIKTIGGGYLPNLGGLSFVNGSTLLLGVLALLAVVYGEFRKRAKLTHLNVPTGPIWASGVRILLTAIVIGYAVYLFGHGQPDRLSFPVTGVILAVLVIVYQFVTQRTPFGRAIYAVGGNRAAAQLSGVNTRATYFFTMANMSFLAAVAAVLYIGRAGASGGQDGTNWELDAIASVFIGGAAVSGGIGTVVGSIIGGLVMAVLNNGLQLLGVGADWQKMIKGLVLLGAVAFDLYSKTQGKPSLIGLIQRTFGGRKSAEKATA
ncbi:sugar ABC transporter permease [Rarobacter faecitabidus]|uniref:Xylose transport system permease protein XylH n=1 Tax=Rarobacter faecitabidus TaxID=13243 RepID=A0A542ZUZ7_RARFA|nr:sugar ABC transporter permease [Rarobacter faecitabidus]TQL64184.1 putative multiple sugar transport system permease protein [Rarobacter faecitabidus]